MGKTNRSSDILWAQERAINISLVIAVVMLVGKLAAYLITNSTAILSDAAESVIHIAACGISAFSLYLSEKPPDREHPYGHGRIVAAAIAFEGGLIFLAAIYILIEATRSLIGGGELSRLDYGLSITLILAAVNLALGLYLLGVGKKTGSEVLRAHGQHVLTDMWTSLAVVIGVFAVWLSDIFWFDPVVAILAAIHILVTSSKLLGSACAEFMETVSPQSSARIQSYLQGAVEERKISAYHQLRHRRVNKTRWVEVHLLLDGQLSVTGAHQISAVIEGDIKALFPDEYVCITTHIEPEGDSGHHCTPASHQEFDPLGEMNSREVGKD